MKRQRSCLKCSSKGLLNLPDFPLFRKRKKHTILKIQKPGKSTKIHENEPKLMASIDALVEAHVKGSYYIIIGIDKFNKRGILNKYCFERESWIGQH